MSRLPRGARVYLCLVCAGAAAALAGSITWLAGAGSAQVAHLAARPELVAVFVQLVVFSIVAQHFPLEIGAKRKQDLSQMVHLAIVLLGGGPLAMVLTGAAEATGQGLFLLRKDAQGRRLRGVNSVLFNTGQITLGVGAAGVAWAAGTSLGAGLGTRPFGIDAGTFLGVLAAGATLYLVNTLAVAAMVALHGGKSPFSVWWEGRGAHALHSAGMLTLGALTAHTAAESPWVPLAMALPAALTYASLKRFAEAEAGIRLRDEFLGVAAHELRTPLRGYAQLLIGQAERNGAVDPVKLSRGLRTIDRQSTKLCGLIDQLLDLTRLQSNSLALERDTIDLADLAREVAGSLQALTPDVALGVHAPQPVAVVADRLRLEQVLTNLITNAARHGGSGGRIDVEVRGPELGAGQVTLVVRDYGAGIPAVARERVFDRFFQASPESKAGGLGLGLYITREIVSLHAGSIRVECPPAGGTRFIVALPAPPSEPLRVAQSVAAAA